MANLCVELRDDSDTLLYYLHNKMSQLSWEWLRSGGCGICRLTLRENFDSDIVKELKPNYRIYIKIDDTTWYAGYVDKIIPKISGKREEVLILVLGFVNQLKFLIVQDLVYTSQELSRIVERLFATYVFGYSDILPDELCLNSGFEDWSSGPSSAPDNWTFSGDTIARESTDKKFGDYSCKITRTSTFSYAYFNVTDYASYQGKKVTFYCWVKSSDANRARISIDDGTKYYSGYYAGNGEWELLRMEQIVSASATRLRFRICIYGGSGSAYFDNAIAIAEVYEDTEFTPDSIKFNTTALEAMKTISDIAGNREWGVGADRKLFFKERDTSIKHYYFLDEDIINFNKSIDYSSIITKLILEGGEVNGEKYVQFFEITGARFTREKRLIYGSVTTQSGAQELARIYLKQWALPKRNYSITKYVDSRLEATIPVGAVAINRRLGINHQYNDGTKYDGSVKYSGGTESFQLEKILYEFRKGEKIKATVSVGIIVPDMVEDLKQLEFIVDQVKNY